MKPHPTQTDYLITEEGDVYSTKYGKLKKRKLGVDYKGYKIINLCNDGKKKRYRVNRLVAETYLPNPDNLPEVNHKDEVKSNNNVANLEWCTTPYNIRYSQAKSYIVENVSTGDRQIVHNLRAFCRDTGLFSSGLYKTLRGQSHHKGYKIIERIK
jgi:hypothetical protein